MLLSHNFSSSNFPFMILSIGAIKIKFNEGHPLNVQHFLAATDVFPGLIK
jgi:hypothetical protein